MYDVLILVSEQKSAKQMHTWALYDIKSPPKIKSFPASFEYL